MRWGSAPPPERRDGQHALRRRWHGGGLLGIVGAYADRALMLYTRMRCVFETDGHSGNQMGGSTDFHGADQRWDTAGNSRLVRCRVSESVAVCTSKGGRRPSRPKFKIHPRGTVTPKPQFPRALLHNFSIASLSEICRAGDL